MILRVLKFKQRRISRAIQICLDARFRKFKWIPGHRDISCDCSGKCMMVKVKCSRYSPGVAQRVGRGLALLFHDRGTRRGWVIKQHASAALYPRERPVPILQGAGWAPGPVWTGGKSHPHRDSIPDRPARSSVAIPTELPGPLNARWHNYIYVGYCHWKLESLCEIWGHNSDVDEYCKVVWNVTPCPLVNGR